MRCSINQQEPLSSPCINICALDEESICMGCFRHIDEIRLWSKVDRHEQEQILANSALRKEQSMC